MFAKSLLKFLLSAILEHCHKYCSKDEFRLNEKFKGHMERYLGTSNTFSTEDRVSQLRLLSPEKKIAKSRGGGGGSWGRTGTDEKHGQRHSKFQLNTEKGPNLVFTLTNLLLHELCIF